MPLGSVCVVVIEFGPVVAPGAGSDARYANLVVADFPDGVVSVDSSGRGTAAPKRGSAVVSATRLWPLGSVIVRLPVGSTKSSVTAPLGDVSVCVSAPAMDRTTL